MDDDSSPDGYSMIDTSEARLDVYQTWCQLRRIHPELATPVLMGSLQIAFCRSLESQERLLLELERLSAQLDTMRSMVDLQSSQIDYYKAGMKEKRRG